MPTPDGQPDEARLDAARDLLLEMELRGAAGGAVDFEALCRARPELESALRAARDEADRPQFHKRGEQASLAQRLEQHLGAGRAGRITLGAEGAPTTSESSASRYTVIEELGRGGMGVVFKVWDADLRRHLAVKVSRARTFATNRLSTHDKQRLARFLDEAQITSQLEHPGIVPVHDVGIDEDGRVYFTMRLVRGRSLASVFESSWSGDAEMPVNRVLEAFVALCDTLAYAHDKGVVHRDLKPSNVMVGRFGAVYVMDWGVARLVERSSPAAPRRERGLAMTQVRSMRQEASAEHRSDDLHTMDGDLVGTPIYMAPEQAAGQLDQIGAHSDIYSIGAILYHFLARHKPYLATDANVQAHVMQLRVLEGPPRRLDEIDATLPPELVAICERAMEREPSKRYSSARELGLDLRAYLGGRVVRAFEQGAWAELRKWVRRNRAFAATGGVLVALLATAPLVMYALDRRARAAERDYADAESAVLELLGTAYQSAEGEEDDAQVRAALDHALRGLDRVAARDPGLSIEWAKGAIDSCQRMGRHRVAATIALRSIESATERFGGDHEHVRALRSSLCANYALAGRFEESAQCARELIASAERADDAQRVREGRAHLLAALVARPAEHTAALEEVRRTREALSSALVSDFGSIGTWEAFAGYLARSGECAEIDALAAEVRSVRGLADTFGIRAWLAHCTRTLDLAQAIAIQEELVTDMQHTLPPADARLCAAHVSLAALLAHASELDAAETVYEEAVRTALGMPPTLSADQSETLERACTFAFKHERWSAAVRWADALAQIPCEDPSLAQARRLRLAEAREQLDKSLSAAPAVDASK
jgi:tRNA A-37 threonylcarbamoyl transferase component Bud32/tetratricopeptide (TPR) repeat protein